MTLPSPHLDDRTFQGLVDEAKRLVQQRCPEWTDHNVSDPGVTLIEAFATMVDQLVYRVNRVPEKSYLTFLDLIGVQLHPPTAAHTEVTFRLSAPRPEPVLVRAGTEVATVRTETEEAVVFTTSEPLSIVPCAFAHLATWPSPGEAVDRTEEADARPGRACLRCDARPRRLPVRRPVGRRARRRTGAPAGLHGGRRRGRPGAAADPLGGLGRGELGGLRGGEGRHRRLQPLRRADPPPPAHPCPGGRRPPHGGLAAVPADRGGAGPADVHGPARRALHHRVHHRRDGGGRARRDRHRRGAGPGGGCSRAGVPAGQAAGWCRGSSWSR
ncbi:hypothetical protein RB201_37235 [Streptomyces sp. S1A(2023)]